MEANKKYEELNFPWKENVSNENIMIVLRNIWKIKGINPATLPQSEIIAEIKLYKGKESFYKLMELSGVENLTVREQINELGLLVNFGEL